MTYEEAVAKGLSPYFMAKPGEKLIPFSEITHEEISKALDAAVPIELLEKWIINDIGKVSSD